MSDPNESLRVLDCKATDHAYLHKDFHGALCYAIKYLDDNFTPEITREYLAEVGRTCFAPLIKRLQAEGLPALEEHWKEVFTKEGGRFTLEYRDGVLVLTVHECPAIAHLKKIGQFFTPRYCETTVVVNETICKAAGHACSTRYQPGEGKCVQMFWKVKE